MATLTHKSIYSYDNGNPDFKQNGSPKVHVIKCSAPSTEKLDTCSLGIRKCLEDIYTSGDIPGYEVKSYTSDLSLDCSNRFSDANTFLDNTRLSDDHGSFVFVNNCLSSDAHVGGAWDGRALAMVAAPLHSGYHMEAIAGQEALHNYIHGGCSKVSSMYGSENDSHELGYCAFIDGAYRISAMAATHEELASNGNCDTYASSNSGSYPYVSSCTSEAVRYIYEHYKNQHNH